MTARGALILVLAALPMAGAQAAAPGVPREAIELELDGTIEVAPDGTVRAVTLLPGPPDAVAALAGDAIRSWRFEPVSVDGRPVPVTTRVQLALVAEPSAEGFTLRVDDVDLGVPRKRRNEAPSYPSDALRSGVGAEVEVLLQVDAGGNVTDVHVEQVSMTDERGKRANFHRERFAQASEDVARRWTFEMTELVDGAPVPATVRIPVTYTLTGAMNSGSEFIDGPVHPSPWPERSTLEFVEDPVGTRL